jgi:uncharacterized protein with HEPN domain
VIDRPLEATLAQLLQAILNARGFVEGLSFEEYKADARTRLAVERCVEIIAEATRRMPTSVLQRYSRIPCDDIMGIGNILRHGYDKVDDRIIWTVIERHLSPLKAVIGRIAAEEHLNLTVRPQ